MEFISVKEAAHYLNKDESTVRKLVLSGKIKGHKEDGRFLIEKESLLQDKYMDGMKITFNPENSNTGESLSPTQEGKTALCKLTPIKELPSEKVTVYLEWNNYNDKQPKELKKLLLFENGRIEIGVVEDDGRLMSYLDDAENFHPTHWTYMPIFQPNFS